MKTVTDEALDYSLGVLNAIYGEEYIYCESVANFGDVYFGHVDFWGVVNGRLHIADLKTGWGNNDDYTAQQIGYALALLDMARNGKWPKIKDLKTATMHLVWEDQRYHHQWDTTYESAKAKIMEIIAKRLTPGIAPQANKNCQWCANLTGCEAVNHEIVTLVSSGLPTKFESPEQMSKAMMLGELVSSWSAKVKELGLAHIKAGNSIPDFKHTLCKGRETSPDLKEAWQACRASLEEEYGDGAKDKFLEACKVSAPKLRKLFTGKEFPAETVMKRGEPYYRLSCKKKLLK